MSDFELPPKNQPKPAVKQTTLPTAEIPAEAPAETSESTSEYNQEELLQIFDNIIFSGEYQETVTIKDRLRIVFRTRTVEEMNDIQNHLDGSNLKLIATMDQVRSLLMLGASLVSFQGKDLSTMKPEEKSKFIGKLASPMLAVLFKELDKFDRKVMAAIQEGEANF